MTETGHSINTEDLKRSISNGEWIGTTGKRTAVHSDFLREALVDTHGATEKQFQLRLKNCDFDAPIDLSGLRTDLSVEIFGCRVPGAVTFEASNMRYVAFVGGVCESVLLERSKIDGPVSLKGSIITVGPVALDGARIEGDLNLDGAVLQAQQHSALFAPNCRIGGYLRAVGAQVRYGNDKAAINLRDTTIESGLIFTGSHIYSPHGSVIFAPNVTINGGIFFDEDFRAVCSSEQAALDFNGARVADSVRWDSATLINGSGPLIYALSARWGRDFSIDNGSWLEGAKNGLVRMQGSSVLGQLILRNSSMVNLKGSGVVADGMTVNSGAFIHHMETVTASPDGTFCLLGSTIGGQLSIDHCTSVAGPGPMVSLDQATIQGGLHFTDSDVLSLSSNGAVRLNGCAIAGNAQFSGGRIVNDGGAAISADHVSVGGDFIVCEKARLRTSTLKSSVRLNGANIAGQLALTNLEIRNANGPALNGQGLRVGDDLIIQSNADLTGTRETLRLNATRVGGSLAIFNSRIECTKELTAVSLQGSRIEGTLRVDVNTLRQRAAHNFLIDLDACVYNFVTLEDIPTSDWVEVLRERTPRYSAQPYQQLAEVLRRTGHVDESKRVLVAQQRDKRFRAAGLTIGGRIWNRILEKTIGYGYRSHIALGYVAIVLLASLGLTLGVGAAGDVERSGQNPQDCSVSEQIALAADLSLPLIGNGPRQQQCQYDPDTGLGQAAVIVSYLLRGLSWTFATLFIAGFTGLVKRD